METPLKLSPEEVYKEFYKSQWDEHRQRLLNRFGTMMMHDEDKKLEDIFNYVQSNNKDLEARGKLDSHIKTLGQKINNEIEVFQDYGADKELSDIMSVIFRPLTYSPWDFDFRERMAIEDDINVWEVGLYDLCFDMLLKEEKEKALGYMDKALKFVTSHYLFDDIEYKSQSMMMELQERSPEELKKSGIRTVHINKNVDYVSLSSAFEERIMSEIDRVSEVVKKSRFKLNRLRKRKYGMEVFGKYLQGEPSSLDSIFS